MQDTEEIWKDIPGFEYYKASNLGRIKSISRIDIAGRKRREIILRSSQLGYQKVLLIKSTKNGNIKVGNYVHRLVLLAFTGSMPKSTDHINGIKSDNRLVNIEDVTQKENIHRYWRKKLRELTEPKHINT